MEPWQMVLGAGAVALAGIITALAAYFKDFLGVLFRRWGNIVGGERFSQGVKRLAEFHTIFEQITAMTFVDRVLIFTGTNCGGVPAPGKPYTVRCFYGWSSKKDSHPEKLYDFDLRVDSHYMNMISDLIDKGYTVQNIKQMKPESQLYRYYHDEGVVEARMYKIHIDSRELMYASIASYREDFSDADIVKIELLIDRVRSIME